jgi:hypothetical protein
MATRAPISPFNAAVGSTSDLKERYYRWFQQEVTRMSTHQELVHF